MLCKNRKCNIICSCVCSCICDMDQPVKPDAHSGAPDFRNIVNIILLGAPETGKSTLMRQMRIIYNGEMSPASLRAYKRDVIANVFNCSAHLLRAVHASQLVWRSRNAEAAAAILEDLSPVQWGLDATERPYSRIPADHASLMAAVWQDEASQMCWQRGNEFNLPESTAYYLSSIERICEEPYVPTQEDVLRLRLPTRETTQNDFINGDWIFRITDIGGQRGSRRRWVRVFDGINAIIFLAALSEYDQRADEEEEGQNRLALSLQIFQEVLRYPGFERTSVIVFLNKTDVLKQRVQTSHLDKYFPDFSGPRGDPEGVTKYIKERFQEVAREENKEVYFHETCATDTHKTKFVFTAVRDDILWRNVKEFVEPFSVME